MLRSTVGQQREYNSRQSHNDSNPSKIRARSFTKSDGYPVFLTLLNILNMVDRTLITSFGTAIIADLRLSDSQFGLLTGPIFVFFYSIMGLFMGALADRVHRPRLIAAGLVLWSALTAVSGMAKSFAHIGIARIVYRCRRIGDGTVCSINDCRYVSQRQNEGPQPVSIIWVCPWGGR